MKIPNGFQYAQNALLIAYTECKIYSTTFGQSKPKQLA